MASDGEVRIDITGNADSLEKSIKQATESIKRETKKWGEATSKASQDMSGDASQAGNSISNTARKTSDVIKSESKEAANAGGSSASKFEQSFTSALKQIGAAFTAAAIGKKIIEFGKDAINAASDLEEVQNVVDVTFGEATSTINAWAKNAINQFGLTETQAKRFASTMGAMLKSSGAASDDIVEMSTSLAGLAADMASFYNLDFDTAFQKIRSGIAGETEPLKQLGINMSVANLEAFALTQGITKAFDKMSQGEQIMLRYQYMMQATADAQGDFARTSDGYANSVRLFQSNIEQLKTTVGEALLDPLGDVIGDLNQIIEIMGKTAPRTLMDSFNDIDFETASKLSNIQTIYEQANTLHELLGEIAKELTFKRDKKEPGAEGEEEETGYFDPEIASLLALGKESKEAQERLKAMGLSSDDIASAQTRWLMVCQDLVKTIPSLSNVIDTNTGEIEGGLEPLQDYIDKWRELQETTVRLSAVEKKRQALENDTTREERWLEMWDAQYKVARLEERLAERGYSPDEALVRFRERSSGEDADLFREYARAVQEAKEAEANYADAVAAHDEAIERLNRAEEELTEQQRAQAEAVEEVTREMTLMERAAQGDAEAIQEVSAALKNAETALKAVDDYQTRVRENVARSIDGVLKGFDAVETPAEKIDKQILQIETDLKNVKNTTERLKLNGQKMQLKLELPTAGKMTRGLEDQTAYMEEYMRYVRELEESVLSPEVLAELADGSTESFDYLKRLAQADEEELLALNDAYAENRDKREEFANLLSSKQLEGDSAYQGLVDAAEEAIEALDMGQGAYDSVAATVKGIIDALADNKASVTEQVDGILAELARLESASYGLNVVAPDFVETFRPNGSTIEQFATGLNYVPHDGFLASLHEGESILTAEEAKVWRQFREGGTASRNSIDYNALSGAIWSSAPSMGGGNVYLDGQTVGRVISAKQADSYRALQRSGWQAS